MCDQNYTIRWFAEPPLFGVRNQSGSSNASSASGFVGLVWEAFEKAFRSCCNNDVVSAKTVNYQSQEILMRDVHTAYDFCDANLVHKPNGSKRSWIVYSCC